MILLAPVMKLLSNRVSSVSLFVALLILEQETVGVRVAGKRKNFRLLYLTIHTSEVMETEVCRVPGGGCGHEAYETGLKKLTRSGLEPKDLKPIPKCSL